MDTRDPKGRVGPDTGEPDPAESAYQARALAEVSRTFALTIPQLPPQLAFVVGNAYLLCRIADTVEDAPELDKAQKQAFAERFVNVVAGHADSASFAAELSPLLSGGTPEAERDLVANTARVVNVTHGFGDVQRDALTRCVAIMSRGMAQYQEAPSVGGLGTMPDMDKYCYYVAGVVGEMLTTLFLEHCPSLRPHRERLMTLAVDFGQALQMTNILKDMWEDRARGACWLPADVFQTHGAELGALESNADADSFNAAVSELIGIAAGHLCRSLEYTLMLPSDEPGIRKFCLWALGMSVLTLRKIVREPQFSSGAEVKISRRSVKATVLVTSAVVRHDRALQFAFNSLRTGLPAEPKNYKRSDVSRWNNHAA